MNTPLTARSAATALTLAASAIAVPAACWAHAQVSTLAPPPDANVTVVVLGFPSLPNGRPSPVQRWRARLAVATVASTGASAIVFTGAGRNGGASEAEVMALIAQDFGLRPDVEIRLETASTDTWQNVAFSSPLIEDGHAIVIVSDPLHAARARSYWLKQRPDDDGRVFVTDQSGFWDGWWLKVPTALDAARQALMNWRYDQGPNASR